MTEFQLVFRKKPYYKPYIRKKPEPKSPRQRIAQQMMKKIAEMSKNMTLEEVARLVGGEIYDREKNLLLVDGQIIPKTAALVKYYMKGTYIGRARKPKKWEILMTEYILRHYKSITLLEKILSEALSVPTHTKQSLSQEAR